MPPTPCPPPAELAAFHHGHELPPGAADALVGHLAGCVRCEAALQALDDGPATAALAVRWAAVAGPVAPAEAEVGAVVGGRYKLVEPLGEGGMGSVWMARQTEPVKRAVAVKLVKPGMDSKAVLARFEAERQALALMDHPNIAKVLDAGATAGRPFFVMELVKGVPITQYCDDHRLTPRERLPLFVRVCAAVQYAHQKGVIHRDLKPGNILVARYDDRPVPKVIDFGVAKATGHQLTDKTLMTGFGAVVGTPEYMSPEQAAFNALDVDTRTDVYALGVLLYELLTGTTPLARADAAPGLLELLRQVRECHPPRPSTRLSDVATLPAVAASRGTDPGRLAGQVRGELDWIVMKALEKDRGRRYQTAHGLAADVQRYLAGEPVQAVPPSAGYRVRTFARRNRGPVLAAGLLLLTLVGGVVGTAAGLVRARHEQDRAQARERDAAEARNRAEADRDEARKALDKAETNRLAAARAASFLYDLLQEADVRSQAGWREAVTPGITLREALDRTATRVSDREELTGRAAALVEMAVGDAYTALGEPATAVPHHRLARTLMQADPHYGPAHPETLFATHKLCRSLRAVGQPAEALALAEDAREQAAGWARNGGYKNYSSLMAASNAGAALRDLGRAAESVRVLEEAVAAAAADPPGTQVSTDHIVAHLAESYRLAGRPADARRVAAGLPDLPTARANDLVAAEFREAVGRALFDLGEWANAEAQFRVALAARRRRMPGQWPTALTAAWMGRAAAAGGDPAGGAALLADACPTLAAARAAIPAYLLPQAAAAADALAGLSAGLGDREAAERWRAVRATYPPEIAPVPRAIN